MVDRSNKLNNFGFVDGGLLKDNERFYLIDNCGQLKQIFGSQAGKLMLGYQY